MKSIIILIIIVIHHDIRSNRESDEIIMNENKTRFILHFVRFILSLHRKSIYRNHIIMDVAFILDKYFNSTKNVSIDVFDAQSLD